MNDPSKPPAQAKVPPPPSRNLRRGLMVSIPMPAAAPDNLSKPNSGVQDLNFKVDPELHRAFKLAATMRGMSMKDLLDASFRCWLEQYGDEQLKALLPPR